MQAGLFGRGDAGSDGPRCGGVVAQPLPGLGGVEMDAGELDGVALCRGQLPGGLQHGRCVPERAGLGQRPPQCRLGVELQCGLPEPRGDRGGLLGQLPCLCAASAVPLNVDLDVALSVLASAVCAALRRRLPGYHTATPDTLQRHFLGVSGQILNHGQLITVRIDRRAHSPVLRTANLATIAVPWWGGRTLRYQLA